MNFASVFSVRRPVRSYRLAAVARTFPSLIAAAALTLPALGLQAAPGDKDTSFNATASGATTYTVLFQSTLDILTIFAGGDLGLTEELLVNGVAKLNFVSPTFGSAGRIEYTSAPERFVGEGFSLPKILIGGFFGQSASQIAAKIPSQNITRIYPDGTQDPSFNVGTGANNYVTAILPLTNGKMVVGGVFTTFNREARLRIVRLFGSGATDESFMNTNFDSDVLTLAEGLNPATGLPDGTTYVGGTFNHVAGKAYGKLVRLDINGNLDATFHPVIDTRVLAVTVQPNGKVIIGGDFSTVNGKAMSHIARLNRDGSLDTTFTATVTGLPTGETNPVAVYVFKPLSDGRIYVGGNFTQIDGTTRRYLGLISADGVLDTTFDPKTNIYDKVQSLAVQLTDGNLLVGETNGPKIGKTVQPSLIRLFGASTGQ